MSSLRCRSGHTWQGLPSEAPEESRCPVCGDTVHAADDVSTFPPSAGLPPPPGGGLPQQLGGYRILEVIGQGGMGRVLLAEDPKLHRRVALKVMQPKFARDEAARQHFLREARTAA